MVLAFDHRNGSLVSLAEAAALSGVHRNTVRGWCTSGRLASVRVNARGARQIRRSDLDAFLADRARDGQPDAPPIETAGRTPDP